MTTPTRTSIAGHTYLALRRKARAEGRGTQELLQLHALEAFVERLVLSPHARNLVLKGGVLLAAYAVRRPTRDVDLAAHDLPNDPIAMREVVADIVTQTRDDGWTYGACSAEVIRESEAYSGVRVTVPCELATARIVFHVDVNVGDVVWPAAIAVRIPRLLGGELAVRGYPLSMVVAEKLVTAVQRGTANTRWRDFADLLLLIRTHAMDAALTRGSIQRVAESRAAALVALSTVLRGYAALAQAKWSAWVRKQDLTDRLPAAFEPVLAEIQRFADPLLSSEDSLRNWDPASGAWTRSE